MIRKFWRTRESESDCNLLKYFKIYLFFAACTLSFASNADFQCVIKDHKWLTDDGYLVSPKNPYQIGAEFTVGRLNGIVGGKGAPMGDMIVLDTGSEEGHQMAWKGVSKKHLEKILDSGAFASRGTGFSGLNVDVMQVMVYHEGEDKSFVYYEFNSVISGTCRAY